MPLRPALGLRQAFRGLPPEVPVLAAVALSVAVGFGILAPAIPLFAREFGVGRTAAGAVVSVFALMRLVSALAGGRLVDRFGERRVLAAGLGIVGGTSLLAGFAGTYLQLLVLRGAGGLGSAMFTVAAASLLLRVVGPDQRGRATGLFQGGFVLGGILGPALGGPLTGASVRVPFFVYAATLAVAGAIALVALRRTQLTGADGTPADAAADADADADAGARDGEAAPAAGLAAALRRAPYRAALVNNLGVGFVLFGARNSLVPLFVLEGLRRGPAWTGAGLVVSSAVAAALLLPAGRFSDERGRRPAMVLGGGLALGSVLLLAAAPAAGDALGAGAYLLAMALFGAGFGFLTPAAGALVGDVAGGRRGTLVAAFQMSSDVGAVAGPLLTGWLADTVSYPAAWAACALVLAAGLLSAARMPETGPVRTGR